MQGAARVRRKEAREGRKGVTGSKESAGSPYIVFCKYMCQQDRKKMKGEKSSSHRRRLEDERGGGLELECHYCHYCHGNTFSRKYVNLRPKRQQTARFRFEF